MPIPFARTLAKNHGKICKVEGCHEPRFRVGAYCKQHGYNQSWHGHPHGKLIRPSEYKVELGQVQAFIKAHLQHPGIVAALKWIEDWQNTLIPSSAAEAKLVPPAIDTMHRLRANDVSPQRILEEACAVWLYAWKYPSRLPDDQRLTYAMSRAIFKLAPGTRLTSWKTGKTTNAHIPVAELKGIGGRIRSTIGALLMNVTQAILTVENHKEQLKMSLRAPFDGHYQSASETTVDSTYLFNQPEEQSKNDNQK